MLSKYYTNCHPEAGMQNWSAVEDNRGVMYFGNTEGILEYDGENWNIYKVANNTPVRCVGKDESGTVYAGAYAEFGRLVVNSVGKMTYESFMPSIDKKYSDFKDIWCIHNIADTVFFFSDDCIFRLVDGKFDYYPNRNGSYYLAYISGGSYYVQDLERGLLKFQNDSLVLINDNKLFTTSRVHGIFPAKNGLLIGTRSDGFFWVDTTSKLWNVRPLCYFSSQAAKVNRYFKTNNYYHGIKLPNDCLALCSVMGDLLIVDSLWNVVDVEEKHGDTDILYLYLQSNNLLWLCLGNGICQVEPLSELRYWPKEYGVYGIVSDVAQNGNYFYISTMQGLFCTSIAQKCDNFGFTHFDQIDGGFEASYMFLPFQIPSSTKQRILLSTSSGVYEVNDKKATRIARYVASYTNTENLYQLASDSLSVLSTSREGVGLLRFENNHWVDYGLQFEIDDAVIGLHSKPNGDIWILSQVKGVYRVRNFDAHYLSAAVVERYDSTSGLPQNRITSFDNGGNVAVSNPDQIYRFNDTTRRYELVAEYNDGEQLVQSSSAGLSDLSKKTYRRVKYNSYSSLCYSPTYNPENYWYSSPDGLVRYSPQNFVSGTGNVPKALIRRVQTADSVIYYGTNPLKLESQFIVDTSTVVNLGTVLDSKHNSVTLTYACPYFERENNVEYSYKLDGFDTNWSEWSTETKKEYTNLNSGDYKFYVKARHLDFYTSQPAVFVFTVLPPWYMTIWALLLYIIGVALLVFAFVRINTIRLIRERNKLEEMVKLRTQEINIQNEEIKVQDEYLIEVNERIIQKNIELVEQKRALEQKTAELEVSNATQKRFFRIIAHDLRNPISTFVTTTNLILSQFDNFDDEKKREIFEELNKMSHNTYNLLENLLDWSTSQMGSMKYEPKYLGIKDLVDENIDLLEAKFKQKNILVEVDVSAQIQVYADENMLLTVIRNLLTNATKFTFEGGKISISANTDSQYCHLSVTDNGIGISPDNIDLLFRIDRNVIANGTNNEKGTGLGLILSHEFMNRLGGYIKVKSTPNEGSTFTISIPLNAQQSD